MAGAPGYPTHAPCWGSAVQAQAAGRSRIGAVAADCSTSGSDSTRPLPSAGPGLAAFGGCGSAMSAAPSASTRWPCWPARSSASTPSDGHHGHEPSTDPKAWSMMQACNACVGAANGRLARGAGTLCPSVRRGMADGLPPSPVMSSRLEAGHRHGVCCRHGTGFHLGGRSHGWMSCPGGCRCGTSSR
jgi:hypothetical protein